MQQPWGAASGVAISGQKKGQRAKTRTLIGEKVAVYEMLGWKEKRISIKIPYPRTLPERRRVATHSES